MIMLCEICKHNNAECVLHRKDENGEDEELYVCKKCMEAADDESSDPVTMVSIKPTIITADGETPPALYLIFVGPLSAVPRNIELYHQKSKTATLFVLWMCAHRFFFSLHLCCIIW